MTNNLIFPIILLCIVLICVDVAMFFFRKKNYGDGMTLASSLKEYFQQIKARLARLKTDQPGTDSAPAPDRQPNPVTASNEDSLKPVTALPEEIFSPAALIISPPVSQDAHAIDTLSEPPNQPSDTINSTSDNKIVHIQISADVPEGSIVHITLEVVDGRGKSSLVRKSIGSEIAPRSTLHLTSETNAGLPASPQLFIATLQQFMSKIYRGFLSQAIRWNDRIKNLDHVLLLGAIAIYALMVGLGIDRYPIYFFTDEAIHMNLASDFLRNGYTNYYGEFLPTFFATEGWVNGTSVYLQVLPLMIFGKSVVVTRLVSAFVTLLGAMAASLLLKDTFKLKYYWAGIFLVITTPAWFLHSRTAFEYVEVGSFYIIFLYFYSRYRAGHLRSFYWAIIAGALAFYAHGLGQILMGVTGLALFFVDFRYHTHPDRRKTVLYGLLLGTILLLPFARYYFAHPGEAAAQVKRRGSYWANENFTLLQKFGEFFKQYAIGLSPTYWYFPNKIDLSRHVMLNYGNGLWFTLPLVITGLIKTFRNLRQPAYRIVLIALLACPIPASVVAIGMPRMVWMTLPLALLGAIGLAALLEWIETHWRVPYNWLAIVTFVFFTGLGMFMLRDALVKGPTWFTDYSLYGMQYGSRQVFQDVVKVGLEKSITRNYVVSPSWANGTEQFSAFFIPPDNQPRVHMGQPIDFIDTIKKTPLDYYFVVTQAEYDKLLANPEFKDITVDQILLFPDGKPGFYVLTLKVSDNIDQIIAAENQMERQPVEDTITSMGQTLRILHSPLGSGRLEDVFDDNPDSLARVRLANPFTFDIYPTTPINTQSVIIQTGSLPDFTVTISLYAPGESAPITYTQTYKGLPPDPLVTIPFDKGPARAERIYIEIKDNLSGDKSQIHVRTILFK